LSRKKSALLRFIDASGGIVLGCLAFLCLVLRAAYVVVAEAGEVVVAQLVQPL
jgi:hypothetical protein